jgi:hypothetical protein
MFLKTADLDSKETREKEDLTEYPVHLDFLVLLERKVSLVWEEKTEILDHKEHLDQKVLTDVMDHLDLKDLVVNLHKFHSIKSKLRKETRVHLVSQVELVLKETKDLEDTLELQDWRENKAFQEKLEDLVCLD